MTELAECDRSEERDCAGQMGYIINWELQPKQEEVVGYWHLYAQAIMYITLPLIC